jgi:hypothetical protein
VKAVFRSEIIGKNQKNFRWEYCFHVPPISGAFLPELARIFRHGFYKKMIDIAFNSSKSNSIITCIVDAMFQCMKIDWNNLSDNEKMNKSNQLRSRSTGRFLQENTEKSMEHGSSIPAESLWIFPGEFRPFPSEF